MNRTLWSACLFFVVWGAVAATGQSAAYPVALSIDHQVYVFDAVDGRLAVTGWNELRGQFEPIQTRYDRPVLPTLVAAKLVGPKRVAILLTRGYRDYELLELLLHRSQAADVIKIWSGRGDSLLTDVQIVGGRHLVLGEYSIVSADVPKCSARVDHRFVASARGQHSVIALATERGVETVTVSKCTGKIPSNLRFRSRIIDLASIGDQWTVIVASRAMESLMLLDSSFRPTGLLPLARSASWRLSLAGDSVVVSAPNQLEGLRISPDGRLSRFTLSRTVAGYVCDGDTRSISATDGRRIAIAVSERSLRWKPPVHVMQWYVDNDTLLRWALGSLSAITVMIVILSVLRARSPQSRGDKVPRR